MPTPSLEQRLSEIERRLTELEKHSHPPMDLTKPVYAAMARILRDAADRAEP
jgi:hypothetical protein